MITSWFMQTGTGFIGWVLSLFPTFTMPSWAGSFMTTLATILTDGANLGAWIPWAVIFGCVSFLLTVWLTGFGMKALRWLVSWIPTMVG